MTLHSIILFLHVGAALGMAATIGILVTYTHLLTHALSPAEARRLFVQADRIAGGPKVLAPILLVTGARLAYERQGLTEPWVIAGALILMFLALTGALVLHPRVRDAVRDAEHARDVTLIARRLAVPWLEWVVAMRATLFALAVFLMTTKPDVRVTLGAAAAAVGVATAATRVRLYRRMARA